MKDVLKRFTAKSEESIHSTKDIPKDYDEIVEIDSTQNVCIDEELSLKKAHIEYRLQ